MANISQACMAMMTLHMQVQKICIGESDNWIISLFLCHCSDIPVLVQIFWIFPFGLSGEAYSIWPAPSGCLSSHMCHVKQSKSEHPIGMGEKKECLSKMQPPSPPRPRRPLGAPHVLKEVPPPGYMWKCALVLSHNSYQELMNFSCELLSVCVCFSVWGPVTPAGFGG